MNGLDWPGLMRAGIGAAGLKPQEFWAMTPAELLLFLGRDVSGSGALSPARLSELAEAFPDQHGEGSHG